ncbi:YbaB/EbfC family nucleoid-associated protein [Paractinoplanes hotanensis]|uniref:YbaB/EbfC family nucleoid-associated protein n=1 Tax=Paractinoplanes hotanensis TaxID=2906497 RepID=A0ABT0YC03_9ACTN|nr:YbaB/EbfC family nucleoid-associated protein [Actinoplanes hotanensis]MCM4083588.1 YbaB/EbfC family nucleoid-associated protein [Actinoplanes hotanensis]
MDLQGRMEGVLAEFERQRSNLAEVQRKMRDLSETATSPRREVSVTVGQNGVLTAIQFPSTAFRRMTPGELSSVLMATYADAKEKVLARSAEMLQPHLSEGADAGALVRGTAKSDVYMPDPSSLPAEIREMFGFGSSPR